MGTLCFRLPVLLESAGTLGRVVTVFIFLAMTFAGITSSVAYIETVVHPLEDFHGKLRRVFLVVGYTFHCYIR